MWHERNISSIFPGNALAMPPGGGGWTDPERGYGDVRPWRPPFHTSPVFRKGAISSKRVSSQDPLLRKFWNFRIYSLNFHPYFQLTSPQIWKFSVHKPPNLEIFSSQAPLFIGKYQFASPTLMKSGPHIDLKKSWVPPPGLRHCLDDIPISFVCFKEWNLIFVICFC